MLPKPPRELVPRLVDDGTNEVRLPDDGDDDENKPRQPLEPLEDRLDQCQFDDRRLGEHGAAVAPGVTPGARIRGSIAPGVSAAGCCGAAQSRAGIRP